MTARRAAHPWPGLGFDYILGLLGSLPRMGKCVTGPAVDPVVAQPETGTRGALWWCVLLWLCDFCIA